VPLLVTLALISQHIKEILHLDYICELAQLPQGVIPPLNTGAVKGTVVSKFVVKSDRVHFEFVFKGLGDHLKHFWRKIQNSSTIRASTLRKENDWAGLNVL
jgi:hypothetical protein